jgi:replicative DNA helicase
MDVKLNRKPLTLEMAYGKIPPQNIKIEEAVLGICMLERDAFATANQYLFSAVFYKESNQKIYESFGKLFDENKPIDILTVSQKLREMGQMDLVGGEYAVMSLTNSVTSSAHLEDWCKILLELYMKREGIKLAAELQVACFEDETDAFDVFNKADHEIINLQEKVLRGQIADINTFTRNVYEQYEMVKQTGVLGIKTGIDPIDKVMCGLVAPDLIIIAARPGSGKTSLAMSITKNITYEQDIAGAWFSLEMDGTQLTRRLVSMVTGINHSEIRHGSIPTHLETEFYKALDNISRKPLFIEDKANINIRDMRARAIVLKRKYNIQYIIVDYIQLMSGVDVKNKNRNDIVGEISRGLKQMAKELNIPVIGLAQLSRAVESRSDKIPQLSDLRESGSIEQDADSVLFLMRPEYYGLVNEYFIDNVEYSTRGLCLGIIGKNRHGETKNIPMEFTGATMEIKTHTNSIQTPMYNPQKISYTQHNIQAAQNVLGERSGDFDEGFNEAELF